MTVGSYVKIFSSAKGTRIGVIEKYATYADGQSFLDEVSKSTGLKRKDSQRFPQAIIRIVDGVGSEELKSIHFNGDDFENIIPFNGNTSSFERKISEYKAKKEAEKAAKEAEKAAKQRAESVRESSAPMFTESPVPRVSSAPTSGNITLDRFLKTCEISRPGYPTTSLAVEISSRLTKVNQYNNCKVNTNIGSSSVITLSPSSQSKEIAISGIAPNGDPFRIGIVLSLQKRPVITIVEG